MGRLLIAILSFWPVQDARVGLGGAALGRDDSAAPEARCMTTATFAEAWDRCHESNELQAALRVVPGGEPLADEPGALNLVRQYVQAGGLSAARLAKLLEVRPSVLDLLLTKPEKLPVEQRSTLLRRAVDVANATAHQVQPQPAVRTAVDKIILGAARTAQRARVVALASGPSGCGKSHAARTAVREAIPGTLVVRVGTDGRSAKGVLRLIGEAAGIGPAGRPVSIKLGIEGLRVAKAALLILDEAQSLSTSAIEAVRSVFDESGVGVLLIGTRVLQRFADDSDDPLLAPLLARISARVSIWHELMAPDQEGNRRAWLSTAELKAILGILQIRADAAAVATLHRLANFSAGLLRRALDTARIAQLVAGPEAAGITAGDVETALRLNRARI